MVKLSAFFFFSALRSLVGSFAPSPAKSWRSFDRSMFLRDSAEAESDQQEDLTRRGLIHTTAGAFLSALSFGVPLEAVAATRKPLPDLVYTILRVREATEQETRLITTGKFKDVQRANIKLAVKFMVENYRLADTLNQSSAYIESTTKRVEAGQVGQSVVQDLLTILEYFDTSDVQNLKVGSDSLVGKEKVVLKGLEAARRDLDTFLAYLPQDVIDTARARVQEENRLNEKEFDKELGVIINLRP